MTKIRLDYKKCCCRAEQMPCKLSKDLKEKSRAREFLREPEWAGERQGAEDWATGPAWELKLVTISRPRTQAQAGLEESKAVKHRPEEGIRLVSTCLADFAAGEVEKRYLVEQSLFNKPKLRMCRRGADKHISLGSSLPTWSVRSQVGGKINR